MERIDLSPNKAVAVDRFESVGCSGVRLGSDDGMTAIMIQIAELGTGAT